MAYQGMCSTFNKFGGTPVIISTAVLAPLIIGNIVGNPGLAHGADVAIAAVMVATEFVVKPILERQRVGAARGSRYVRRFQMAGYVAGAIGGAMIFNAMAVPVNTATDMTAEAEPIAQAVVFTP